MELSMEKITQIVGELYLENRLALEREQTLQGQVATLAARLKNIEEKVDE